MKYTLTLVSAFAEGTATAKYNVDGAPPGIGETLWYNKHEYTVTAVHRWFKESCWVEGCDLAQTDVEVVAEDDVVIARRYPAAPRSCDPGFTVPIPGILP